MRFLTFLSVFSLFFTVQAMFSEASARKMSWEWLTGHSSEEDFKPYLEEQQIRQRSLWDGDDWTPQAWIADAEGDAKSILRELYAADILSDQYVDGDDIPVLEVGRRYFELSGVDQRRVLTFVDYVFEITASGENGMFYIVDRDHDHTPSGVYTKTGLQSY